MDFQSDKLYIHVGVVPNSLQDIGRASDGAERRSVAGGLGRSIAESEARPIRSRPCARYGTVYTSLLGFRGDLILL